MERKITKKAICNIIKNYESLHKEYMDELEHLSREIHSFADDLITELAYPTISYEYKGRTSEHRDLSNTVMKVEKTTSHPIYHEKLNEVSQLKRKLVRVMEVWNIFCALPQQYIDAIHIVENQDCRELPALSYQLGIRNKALQKIKEEYESLTSPTSD